MVHFHEMDLFTYSILLDYLCKNRHLDEAMSLLKDIEGSNMEPDVQIYNILIDGLCKGLHL